MRPDDPVPKVTDLAVPPSGLWLPPGAAPADDLATIVQACTPEQLAEVCSTLAPDDLAIVERIVSDIARAGWRSTPATMAAKLDRSFKLYGYSQLLARKFVDAVEGRSIRQIWNLPARYGKSLVASKWGPTWAFDRHPGIRLILASYGKELAVENAIFVRDALVDHDDVLGATLQRYRRRQDRFVTSEGGGLIAGGIGSRLTGFGGDGAIIDDPFKDWQEAHSEAARQRVWNWYRAVLRLRLEQENSWIIVVMTRWHEEDLTGMLLDPDNDDGEEWDLVRLPAIADDPANDPLGRALGEPLEPLRFSLRAVLQRARALGSYLSSGLEQQRPSPEEGEDIRRGWWKWFDTAPPKFDDSLSSWDMKLKDKETGDFVVGQVWGRAGSGYWLIDQFRGRWDFPTTKAAIVLSHVRHPWVGRHIIENTGNGPEVMTELRVAQPDYKLSEKIIADLGITKPEIAKVEAVFRRGMDSLIAENPKGDKRARMRAQTGKIEGGNVHVPNYRGIGLSVVNEAAAFPNGAHDDQVDSLSQALKKLSGGRARAKVSRGKLKTPAPGARATPRGLARKGLPTRAPQPNRNPRRRVR